MTTATATTEPRASRGVQLDEIVPFGRSFDEYRRMFKLGHVELAGRILGCGDGPAAFNADATAAGHRVVSCDPIYAFTAEAIAERIDTVLPEMRRQVEANRDLFLWDHFTNVTGLLNARCDAMDRFLDDYPSGRRAGRYIDASLPNLPFSERRFDLAVVSHLLFLYSQQLDERFHIAALEELLRVAGEVRVFPLLALDGRPSPHLPGVLAHFARMDASARIEPVPYEFQRGANQMLVLHAGPHSPFRGASSL
ncbi:MAG: SAM-dependent methyltransferase [Planctomycetota bacterium]